MALSFDFEKLMRYRKAKHEFHIPEIKLPYFLATSELWNRCIQDTDDVQKYEQIVDIIFKLPYADFTYLEKEMIVTELAMDIIVQRRNFNPFLHALKKGQHYYGVELD